MTSQHSNLEIYVILDYLLIRYIIIFDETVYKWSRKNHLLDHNLGKHLRLETCKIGEWIRIGEAHRLVPTISSAGIPNE